MARVIFLATLFGVANFSMAAPECPLVRWPESRLDDFVQSHFEIENEVDRNALAMTMPLCLKVRNQRLRDTTAYSAISAWLRNGKLTTQTKQEMSRALIEKATILIGHQSNQSSEAGFELPFSILVLAELARADRLDPYWSRARLEQVVVLAVRNLHEVKDYRGFDEQTGWRHQVAHGADLAMQLSLNARLSNSQLHDLAEALLSQVSPNVEHFYRYGEPERLARALVQLDSRQALNEAQWRVLFEQRVLTASPHASWSDVFKSQRGLAKRHNTMQFLTILHAMLSLQQMSENGGLFKVTVDAMKSIP